MSKRLSRLITLAILGAFLLGLPSFHGSRSALAQPQALAEIQWVENRDQSMISNTLESNTNFGTSIENSADGNRLVAGEGSKNVGLNSQQGTATIYQLGPLSYSPMPGGMLQASDGAANDHFGVAVAISGDGNTVLVGANMADGPARGATPFTNEGSAYIFTWNGASWSQEAILTPTVGQNYLYFGSSVALSSDGKVALVGATGYDGAAANQGALYVFNRGLTNWSQSSSSPILAADASANDYFGGSVDLNASGTTALASAPNKASNMGAAYVFTYSSPNWTQQAKLSPGDGAVGDDFGRSVSLSDNGNTALVGAPNAAVQGAFAAGAAYRFTRSGSTWSASTKMTAPTRAANEWFGFSVHLSGDGLSALVGVPHLTYSDSDAVAQTNAGGAWLFYGNLFASSKKLVSSFGAPNSSVGWSATINQAGTQLSLGIPSRRVTHFTQVQSPWFHQATIDNSAGASQDYLGYTVAISSNGNTALAAGYNMNEARVYVRTTTQIWAQQATLLSSSPSPTDFGRIVALSGDGNTALVSDPPKQVVYIFTRTGSTWSAPQAVASPDMLAGGSFGGALAISSDGSTAAIGDPTYYTGNSGNKYGAVYVMMKSSGTWGPLVRYQPNTPVYQAYFGSALALSANGATLLIGANGDSGPSANTGAAYVFTRPGAANAYTQHTKFINASSITFDNFGFSVALSGDGTQAFVAKPAYGSSTSRGETTWYIYTAGAWEERQIIWAPDGNAGNKFGFGLGLSADATRLVVGAPGSMVYGRASEGAAYVFQLDFNNGTATLSGKLALGNIDLGNENASRASISADGSTIITNAFNSPYDNTGTRNHGGVVFYGLSRPASNLLYLPQFRR